MSCLWSWNFESFALLSIPGAGTSLERSAVIGGFPKESRRCACIEAELSQLVPSISSHHLLTDTQGSQRITIDPIFVHIVHMA